MQVLLSYQCPECGTGRWHARGCPNGAPDRMADEWAKLTESDVGWSVADEENGS